MPQQPNGAAVVVQTGRACEAICTACPWAGESHYGRSPRSYEAAAADRDAHNQEHHPENEGNQ